MVNNIQNKIIEEVKVFADSEIRPFATIFDQKCQIPRELINKLGSQAYFGATFPEKYGGLALDPIDYGLLTKAIGMACSSVRAMLTVHTSLVGEALIRFGTEDQKREFLPPMAKGEIIAAFALSEPDVGSDAKSVQTSYQRIGGDYIIDGVKKWITLGGIADLFLVIASDKELVTAFLVPAQSKGITITPINGLMASRAAHVAEITFDNVVVSKKNMLGKEGSGFTYIVNTSLDHGRYSIAWGGLAIAQEALEAMVTYARSRQQFGNKIYKFQLVQAMIADSITKLTAGRALCLNAGELRKRNHSDLTVETTIAKYYTSKIANEITSDAVQIHGANGISDKYPVERLFREAKVLEIIEGTSQVLQGVIANHGLRKYYIPKKNNNSCLFTI